MQSVTVLSHKAYTFFVKFNQCAPLFAYCIDHVSGDGIAIAVLEYAYV